MLIETHSDLIFRRIQRAVLEEYVASIGKPQQAVGINFTRLVDDPKRFKYAELVPLAINDECEIDNWPDGFMDDDLLETQRFIHAANRRSKRAENSSDGE